MSKDQPKTRHLSVVELEGLKERLRKSQVVAEDHPTLIGIIETLEELQLAIEKKDMTIQRLRRSLFGKKTEKRKARKPRKRRKSAEKDGKPKGHGRNPASAYRSAETVFHQCEDKKPGDRCCAECEGRLFDMNRPGVSILVTGQPPLKAERHVTQKLRCSKCQRIVCATPPSTKKYDASAMATLALLRFGLGFPLYRLDGFQANLGVPLADSTQWDLLEELAKSVYPVFLALIQFAASQKSVFLDDTGVTIMELLKENQATPPPQRTGMRTTGMVARGKEKDIFLYFHGRKHAGENLDDLLKQRPSHLPPMMQISDALACNTSHCHTTTVVNCLAHARRNFVEIEHNFPEQAGHVIEELGKVYWNDQRAKQQQLDEGGRLAFHKAFSESIMADLKAWLNRQLKDRLAEPNSAMGKAINYMLNHWLKLTQFLRVPGAPLDNNTAERALKTPIMQRKNSQVFRTEHGAFIGSIFTSVIKTCAEAGENPLDYMVALKRNAAQVRRRPSDWLPWNYLKTLALASS